MTALLILAMLVLIALNGFFVAAEFALVRSRKAHLKADVEAGRRGAAQAVRIMEDLSRYLSAVQVGITLTSLGIGFIGEPAIGSVVEGIVGEGVPRWVSGLIAFSVAYLIATSLHITFGEQIPKIYAIQTAEPTARLTARPLLWFTVLFSPFISLLNGASNGVLRLIGVRTSGGLGDAESSEELRILIQESVVGGKLDPGEGGMLAGVFHLHEQQARQVMTPSPAIVTVDVSEDVETALRRCVSSGHTRLVVTEDHNEHRVKGIVHNNALTQLLLTDGAHASIDGVVREAPIVPETKPLDDLLADLQRSRSALAVVVDEYGRTAGIVTVEDIVEEVVGEINDETDPLGSAVRKLGDGEWFVRGHVAITDLLDYGLELPVDTNAYNSVGGFVFGELGRLPARGDTVTRDGLSIRVESVRENRVEAVRIRERRSQRRAPSRRMPDAPDRSVRPSAD